MERDSRGLIVHRDGDQGDCAADTGVYYFGRFASQQSAYGAGKEFMQDFTQLEIAPGVLVRHPDNWNDPADFSRDQQDSLVACLGAFQEHAPLRRIFRAHLRRFGKFQNKDWAGPITWGVYIRAFNDAIWWPLLLLIDWALVINSILVWFDRDPNSVDDRLHLVRLEQAYYFMPTPISWLARRIYSRLRPWNEGCIEPDAPDGKRRNFYHPVFGALRWYHRIDNPEIAEAHRPIIERIFK